MLELSNKQLDVAKQLANCVQGECKPMITQCSMEALYKLGKEHQAITDIAKDFERRRCNHRTAIEEIDCIKDVVGPANKHRYTMAVQSAQLRQHLRAVPGVPVIHFNERGVMVMEMPSDATLKQKDRLENAKLTEQLANPLPTLDNVIIGENPVVQPTPLPARSRKTTKAANPLSQKKKKEVQSGRPSKKQLQAELELQAEMEQRRAQKRPRDTGESDDEKAGNDDETAPTRSENKGAHSDLDDHTSAPPADAAATSNHNDDTEQKKKRRKRRKKGPAAAQDAPQDSDIAEEL
ncbi:hypothetical protein QFC22_003269 [Naganishia vaughanmartiniae]|uniref:Uncharacterized protein n=1 Tax=Naganishia vaughanmartiniae TaxID=1424756 RepID=A0ACC2X680_9TREE|nr:hypothetical protein QFC22_003269 [Naganishia vaughanmartiniae]